MTDGIIELSRDKLPRLIQLNKLGTLKEAANHFGGIQNMIEAYYNVKTPLPKNLIAVYVYFKKIRILV